MDKVSFDARIESMIARYEYPVYVIHPDEKIDCACQDFTTHQGDPHCRHCFGLGKKITIRKLPAAVQPCINAATPFNNEKTARVYYTRHPYPVKKYDVIVDRHHVDVVQQSRRFQSDHYKPVYFMIQTLPMDMNRELFYTLFYDVVLGGDPYRQA